MLLPSPIFRAALNAMNRNSLTGLAPIADITAVARSSRAKLRNREGKEDDPGFLPAFGRV